MRAADYDRKINYDWPYPISGQCSHFIPSENTRKPLAENFWFSGAFRGYKMGTLARNGLNNQRNIIPL